MLTTIRRAVPHRISRRLYTPGVFRVEIDDHHSFRLRSNGFMIENRVFWRGLSAYESAAMVQWIDRCAEAKVIFDIGANIGLYSLVAKTLNPDALVCGFEAMSDLYEKFSRNCRLNKLEIRSFREAVCNVDGEAQIHFEPNEPMIASLRKGGRRLSETVKSLRLDSFVKREGIDRIDLMKIDVECLEPEVLDGMGDTLKTFRPTIIVEILDDPAGERIERMLTDYTYYCLDDSRGSIEVPHLHPSSSRNFLLEPGSKTTSGRETRKPELRVY
jgi:FkbM family methyltransferase